MDPKVCYIAHGIEDNISFLKQILKGNDISFIDIFSISELKNEIIVDIKEKIKISDFTIGVLNSKSQYNSNVLFEIGVSYGLGKPTFIILSDNIIDLPSNLKNIKYYRSPLDNIKLLNLGVSDFLEELQKKRKTKKFTLPKKSPLNENLITGKLNEISNIRRSGDSKRFDLFVNSLFEDLKINFSKTDTINDRNFDFIIWQEDQSGNASKLLLVETKIGNLNFSMIKDIENQLKNSLIQEKSEFGLLLYLDKSGKKFTENYSLSPLIIRMDIEDFVKSLDKNNITSLLLERRNQIVNMEY